ncbi:hypothetical protein MKW94_013862 [Papaver nudicaule]|uniref:Uncharacterized protein n=1 Tax=Papaver nudicaule TaxID=74823 RepID=A0AA41RSH1_PAPNU|nr:hypothetical protein [Papaver nudicaule]
MDLRQGESSVVNLDPQIPEQLHESKEKSLFKDLYKHHQCRYIPEIIHKSKKKKQQQLSIEERRQRIKKLEERFVKLQRDGGVSSEDEHVSSPEDEEDEEIHVPKCPHWFNLCLEVWGTSADRNIDAIKTRVKESGLVFEIHTAAVFSDDGKAGCGAVLRDCFRRPIAASSRAVSGGISTFYYQLQGVLLGVQMAKEYQVPQFKLYCSSGAVSNFVLVAVRRGSIKCFCGDKRKLDTSGNYCINCFMCRMKTDNEEEAEKGYKLFSEISSCVLDLERQGLPYFSVCEVEKEKNEPARWMAQLGENREMDLLQISESEGLSDILYKDAFGHLYE